MGEQILWLWRAGSLVALFGIWFILYTRLPSGNSNQTQSKRRLTKKEREAQERQDAINRGVAAALAAKGIKPTIEEDGEDVGDGLEPVQPVSQQPKPSKSQQIRARYQKGESQP